MLANTGDKNKLVIRGEGNAKEKKDVHVLSESIIESRRKVNRVHRGVVGDDQTNLVEVTKFLLLLLDLFDGLAGRTKGHIIDLLPPRDQLLGLVLDL